MCEKEIGALALGCALFGFLLGTLITCAAVTTSRSGNLGEVERLRKQLVTHKVAHWEFDDATGTTTFILHKAPQ